MNWVPATIFNETRCTMPPFALNMELIKHNKMLTTYLHEYRSQQRWVLIVFVTCWPATLFAMNSTCIESNYGQHELSMPRRNSTNDQMSNDDNRKAWLSCQPDHGFLADHRHLPFCRAAMALSRRISLPACARVLAWLAVRLTENSIHNTCPHAVDVDVLLTPGDLSRCLVSAYPVLSTCRSRALRVAEHDGISDVARHGS